MAYDFFSGVSARPYTRGVFPSQSSAVLRGPTQTYALPYPLSALGTGVPPWTPSGMPNAIVIPIDNVNTFYQVWSTLQNYRIPFDTRVILTFAATTYDFSYSGFSTTGEVLLNHPDGDRIYLIGTANNTTAGTQAPATRFVFPTSQFTRGLVVRDGYSINLINLWVTRPDSSTDAESGSIGISAQWNSFIQMYHCSVKGFEYGIYTNKMSTIFALSVIDTTTVPGSTLIRACAVSAGTRGGRIGFNAADNSYIYTENSYVSAVNSGVSNNYYATPVGYQALYNSTIIAKASMAKGINSYISSAYNVGYGFASFYSSNIEVIGMPAVGLSGTVNGDYNCYTCGIGLYAFMNSTIRGATNASGSTEHIGSSQSSAALSSAYPWLGWASANSYIDVRNLEISTYETQYYQYHFVGAFNSYIRCGLGGLTNNIDGTSTYN